MRPILVALLLVSTTILVGTAAAEEPLIDTEHPLEPRCDRGGYVCTGPCQLGAGPVWMRVYCV